MTRSLVDFKEKRICQCFECADYLNELEKELQELYEWYRNTLQNMREKARYQELPQLLDAFLSEFNKILGVKQESKLVADNNPNDFGWHSSSYKKKGTKP